MKINSQLTLAPAASARSTTLAGPVPEPSPDSVELGGAGRQAGIATIVGGAIASGTLVGLTSWTIMGSAAPEIAQYAASGAVVGAAAGAVARAVEMQNLARGLQGIGDWGIQTGAVCGAKLAQLGKEAFSQGREAWAYLQPRIRPILTSPAGSSLAVAGGAGALVFATGFAPPMAIASVFSTAVALGGFVVGVAPNPKTKLLAAATCGAAVGATMHSSPTLGLLLAAAAVGSAGIGYAMLPSRR